MAVACPHCTASNTDGTRFCVSCGKAVPAAARAGPRVLNNNDLATSSAGQTVQLNDLERQIKPAIKTLLGLGVLHAFIGAIYFVGGLVQHQRQGFGSVEAGGVLLGFGAGFFGLSYWARKSPLPATVTALSIYGTLIGVDTIITAMTHLISLGLAVLVVIRIMIIAVLARAVHAAVKHRALSRQMAQSGDQQSFRQAA
jgi:hypothetical protein